MDLRSIRSQFPILNEKVYGLPLVYLDNAASTQKPLRVIEALDHYYRHSHSNVHRGVHQLSQQATDLFERCRTSAKQLVGAAHDHEMIMTRGTTEAINLVAYSFGQAFIKEGDEVLITAMEHHSNIVPWQMMCERHAAVLRVAPITEDGSVDLEAFENLLCERTKLVAFCHVSNALGTVNPVAPMVKAAHAVNAAVLVDGAQAVPHQKIDVQALDVDFYAFSSHKMYGPTGIGFLYGKEKWLDAMPPYQGGGEMIDRVSFEKTTYNGLPFKFEAGTPNIADAVAFPAAVEFMNECTHNLLQQHEKMLVAACAEALSQIEGVRLVGTAPEKASVVSFVLEGTHPADVGAILDRMGIAVRTGHHCTMPLMERLGLLGTVRASWAVYNTLGEVEALAAGVKKAARMLR